MATLLAKDLYLYAEFPQILFKQRSLLGFLFCRKGDAGDSFSAASLGIIKQELTTKPFGLVLPLSETIGIEGEIVIPAELSLFGNPEDPKGTVTAYFSFHGQTELPDIEIQEVDVFDTVQFVSQNVATEDPIKADQLFLTWSKGTISYKAEINKEFEDIDLTSDKTTEVREATAFKQDHSRVRYPPPKRSG